MVAITLPDGSQRQFDGPVTGVDIAADIGPGLAKAALAIRLDGEVKDLATRIDTDAEVAIITDKDDDTPDRIRHSAPIAAATSPSCVSLRWRSFPPPRSLRRSTAKVSTNLEKPWYHAPMTTLLPVCQTYRASGRTTGTVGNPAA